MSRSWRTRRAPTRGRLGGYASLRNVVYRNVTGYEKEAVGDLLSAVVEASEDALAEELGSR